jgi:signal transduction histidine kinase
LFYENRALAAQDWDYGYYILGIIYGKLGQDSLALKFSRKAISMVGKEDQKDRIDYYNGISQLFFKEGSSDSAIHYSNLVLQMNSGRSHRIGALRASALLAEIYGNQKKPDSTIKYLKLTIALNDSLFSQQKTREAQTFAFNEQLHQQELQQQLEQSELKYKSRLNIYALLVGLLILAIVAVGLWRRNIYKQRSFAILQKQKQEIDVQKEKAEKTLDELKTTQAQLIQSEKMASLGELTAGIAHEIQNPLNFVNNFSEVNNELISELVDEVDKGNYDEVKVIAVSLKDNEEKINHHGKRADAIVKGMLQHSKSTSGQKELTDINKLADEYLRLSYHGLRAKDKSFNAEFKTDFDEIIEKINVVPQDMGRVLLNLFNNAFYAVNERQKVEGVGFKAESIPYVPVVALVTRKAGNKVEIVVKDNGNGIPQNIVDKIFQPFFTTKPTGQGTGLGLSLAYDIITKEHNGTVRAESKENEGSTFVIQLPIK